MSVSLLPPSPEILFRLATQADIPSIVDLIKKVRSNLNEAQHHFLKDKAGEDLAHFIDQGFPTVIALRDNKVIALAISTPQGPNMGATHMPDMFNRGHYMCIGTVAVDPEVRGIGLGKQIISAAFAETVNYMNAQGSDSRYMGVIAKVSDGNENPEQNNGASLHAFAVNNFNKAPQTGWDPSGYHFSIMTRLTSSYQEPTIAIIGKREEAWARKRAQQAKDGIPIPCRG